MGSPPLKRHMAPHHQHQQSSVTTTMVTTTASAGVFPTMSYAEALKHRKDPFVREMIEERNIILSWQEAGRITEIVRREVDKSLGQYRNSIRAIPLAIHNVQIKAPCYVIEDHPCIHLDIVVKMIAFRIPKTAKERKVHPLKCVAAHVTETSVIGWLYGGLISVIHTPGIPHLKAGDEFQCQMVDFHYRGGLVQLQTTSVRRAGKRQREAEEDGDESAEPALDIPVTTGKKQKQQQKKMGRPRKRPREEETMEIGED